MVGNILIDFVNYYKIEYDYKHIQLQTDADKSASLLPAVTSKEQALKELTVTSLSNDLYSLFQLNPSSSIEEIERKWHELLKYYHPEIFNNKPHQKVWATKVTLKLNDAYLSVFTNPDARTVYHTLIEWRANYETLSKVEGKQKVNAIKNLNSMKAKMNELQMPQFLVREVEQAVNLLNFSC